VSDDLPLIADVALDVPGRDAYSYLVPPELADLAVGECVLVPFGPRRERGFVAAVGRRAPPDGVTLKAVLDRRAGVRLPPALMDLIRWAASYYRCSLGEFFAGVVPAPVREGTAIKRERMLRPVPGFAGTLTARQQEVLKLLPPDAIPFADARRRANCTGQTLERMVTAGALVLDENQDIQETRLDVKDERFALTDEQQAVVTTVAQALDEARHETYLLYGVTGSGKTLAYLELAEKVIASGKQVLVLLPEIGLTPQLAARFRRRFERVVVWHSGFTAGERAEQWRQVAQGEVDLVIGARSALFAPMPAPGLIVVDEEHDSSYKQDSTPRYQARDLAIVYARQLSVPVILGTATPSLESYQNARTGRYTVLTMRDRPAGGALPTPTVIDMGEECRRQKRHAVLSEELVEALRVVRDRKEQAIVLLNRRGWSPVVSCMGCGHAMKCPQCDVSLTYHKGQDLLRCHYCGHFVPLPRLCPACEQPDLSTKGVGTEQLTAQISELVPGLRLLRVDADTVGSRQGHARVLKAFSKGEADCMVGTQMVAKGLDFPRVTLVGVVAADHGLSIPDFRASERTYQLVAQVAGRAGRGERPGRVIVQAFDAEAPPIACALRGRPKTFYTAEIDLRSEYGYPPAGGLLRILWRGEDAARVQAVAEEHSQRLQAAAQGEVVLGPTPAGLAFLKGQHRWHALVKAASRGAAQQFLDRLLADGPLKAKRGVKVAVDVDPYAIS
jgi:primosomal protein N' (replication factor Y)